METITTSQTLVVEECYNCHVKFAMPHDLYQRAQETDVWFYCPNGHKQHYTQTENIILRQKLERAEADAAFFKNQRDGALQEITVQKRNMTRLKNRIKAGVCPECHRTIKQLSDHTRSCHMGKEESEKVAHEHTELIKGGG